ncbi:protein-glutamate methylesterase/protein-glutamine glutaminase [Natronospora cellulosivora (SeqCode)]
MSTIKVLIIDDSAMVRKILKRELEKEKEIEVVGTAPDPYIGRDKIIKLKPDVVLLDIEMPKMDGLTFLEKLMRYYPLPVIIISSLAECGGELALKAIELGAAEVIAKPGSSYTIGEMTVQVCEKIKAVNKMSFKKYLKEDNLEIKKSEREKSTDTKSSLLKTSEKIIAIGASTGGTKALKVLLSSLPAYMPPILLVQHMPEHFTSSFARSLNSICHLNVEEASDGDLLSSGKVLLAPGNKHILLKRSGASFYVEVSDGEMVHHQRPSVDVLFNSVAQYAGRNAIGVILTGMGKDGASGLLAMKKEGAYTIAQDEASCIVYGMPKEAVSLGAVDEVVPLKKISSLLLKKT